MDKVEASLRPEKESRLNEMCHCTTTFDVRCRCNPDDYEAFQICPVRVDTALWLLDNDDETCRAARQCKFPILYEWFHQDLDRQEVILLYTQSMLEEIGKCYIDELPVSIAREHEWDEEDWIVDDMECNGKEAERQEYILWIQKRIECKLRIFRLKEITGS